LKWQRWLVIAFVLAMVVAGVIYGFRPQPVLVDTARAIRGPLQVVIEEEGKTRVKERFEISAPVAGVVQRIELDVGDPVSKGQVLARLLALRSDVLDPRSRAQALARVAAAEAAHNVARENARAAAADADYARAELARVRKLHNSGGMSQDTLDQADAAFRRAEANKSSANFAVEVARFELEAARSALEHSAARDAGSGEPPEQVTVRAPVDGQVLKVYQRSEYVVAPGQVLLEIGDPGALEVEIDVLSADAVRIQPGGKVLFERWGGDGILEGRVRVVEPVGFTKVSALGVEEQRVWVIVDFVSPREQWQRLGDGYRVDASFVLWEADDVLQVPTSAVFRQGNGWAVFVVEDETARLRSVEPGRRGGLRTQIVSGLDVGETVITHPGDTITDGVRVQMRSNPN